MADVKVGRRDAGEGLTGSVVRGEPIRGDAKGELVVG
jgi:hypothetical protein